MSRTISLLLWLLIASTALAEPMIRKDVPYADVDHPKQRLDIYAPGKGKDHPIVIWIHGGGWRQGDKASVQRKPRAFVQRGYVFVSVNYRLVPQVTLKDQMSDMAKAIKWVVEHAREFGGDAEHLIVAGHSAGAHLAALLCTDPRYLKAEGLSFSIIKGCIPVDTAVYDVVKQIKQRGPRRSEVYTAVFGKTEQTQREYSPVNYVKKGQGIPPFLILHVADRPDSSAQSRVFAQALRDAGLQAKTVAGEGKTHATINRELGLSQDKPTQAVFEFLESLKQAE